MPYQIRVFELSVLENRRNPALPCLYVMLQKIDRHGNLVEKLYPDWVACGNPMERQDLGTSTVFHKMENARKRMRSLVETLSRRGHTVNRCNTAYRLYVIELEPNPERDGESGAVYVGETAKSREDRFAEHMAGGKRSSRHVSKRGIKLCPDLTPRQEYYTREASREAEARLAERLRGKGYAVYGGT
jgi:hypothetical protein